MHGYTTGYFAFPVRGSIGDVGHKAAATGLPSSNNRLYVDAALRCSTLSIVV
jgi:hypothetical protein